MDFRLQSDKTLVVAGPSHCGKTEFTLDLLDKRHELFKEHINRVIWCYGIYHAELALKLQQRHFTLHKGIISSDAIYVHVYLLIALK